MSNLVDELTADYFNSRFRHSMFLDSENRASMVLGTSGRHSVLYNCVSTNGVEEKATTRSFFKDMTVFSTPTLGWRSVDNGKRLVHFTRNNGSYHRGTCRRNLQVYEHPLSNTIRRHEVGDTSIQDMELARMVLKPEYKPFREGVQQLLNGDVFSFAVSPHIAVIANSEGGGDVLFSTRIVGTVNGEGHLACNIPTINLLLEEDE